jgi:D-3-phosphoglycerate dehydrogenase
MMIQILEPADYSPDAINIYRQLGEVVTGACDNSKKPQVNLLVSRLSVQLDRHFLDPYTSLEAIASPTTGLSHIDTEYCRRRSITVYSLQQHRAGIEKITSTSELAFGLMLALLRSIPRACDSVVHNHQWQRELFRARQLSELTLGLVGLGRTGGHMAGYAKAFGMRVLAHDPWTSDERFSQLGVVRRELNDLCRQADIISIHANERNDNHHLLGQEQIALMKHDALLINTARGSLLDESAVAAAVLEQRLGGVACDVLEYETTPGFITRSPLARAAAAGANVLLTPHIGGCTRDAMHMTEAMLAQRVSSSLELHHG